MSEALAQLLALAEIDVTLRTLDGRLSDLEREEARLKDRLAEEDDAFCRRQEAHRALRLSALSKSGEVDATDEKIRTYQHKLDHDIIPYKEMEYLREQVAFLRGRLDELADEALRLIVEAEADEGKLNEDAAEHEQRRARIVEDLAMLGRRQEQTSAERDALRVKRAGLSGQIPSHLRGRYERLLASGGSPVVPVAGGMCGGCHLRLVEVTVEKVKADREVVTCEHCSRFLYWRPS